MINEIEDNRNEFKEILNDKFEKEVVSFLTANGGNIYIGVRDNGEIIGIDDTDKLQLIIKDRIKNNIAPSTLGLFDINVKSFDNKKYIHITIASGNEKPYYIRKKGMTPEGCYIRIGSSCEQLNEKQIEEFYSKRTRTSLTNIISPKQNLTFSQLKIYYEEKGYNINDNFLRQLDLIMDDGKYNYLAYLLSDSNNISIKVATYSGCDAYDLVENEEYGYCCLIKAAHKVIDKFELINKTFTKITGDAERKEIKMFDKVAVREAILNAFVHTLWEREYPPKFEIFSDHIAISSTGGLPLNVTKDDFLKGFSAPTHPELMRVFKDLELVEQLGTGIIRILKSYDKNVYEFSDNFIRVNFAFRDINTLSSTLNTDYTNNNLSETQKNIMGLIKEDDRITQTEITNKLGINKTTVTRNLKTLKEKNIITRIGSNKTGRWEII